MWAPGCTVVQFRKSYLPAFRKDQIKHLNLFTLTDHAEQDDNAFIYPKSLLYLVDNAFEGGSDTNIPLLGMSRYIEDDKELLSDLKAIVLHGLQQMQLRNRHANLMVDSLEAG
jgi:hypothetical protein